MLRGSKICLQSCSNARKTPRCCSSICLEMLRSPCGLRLGRHVDSDIRRRNCDAAVKRSPAFEAVDEIVRLRAAHTANGEVDLDRIEQRKILPNRLAASH